MEAAAAIGRKSIRIANGIVNMFVLIAILLLLAFSSYAMWDAGQVYAQASPTKYIAYKPTTENQGLSFGQLQAVNPEVFAWLTVYGTHIDYPVAQGTNDLKYVNTDASGKYSLSGSIFLDFSCAKDFSDFSSIIFGHHMDKEAMFGEIGLFNDKSYFDAREYGSLYFGGQEHGLEFFAFVHADAYDTDVFRTKITGAEAQQAYLNLLLSRATNVRTDVSVAKGDHIVLLSTCANSTTNGRDILIGKITSQTYPDTFKTDITKTANLVPLAGVDPGFWAHVSFAEKFLFAALLFLVVLLVVFLLIYKRKKRARSRSMDATQNRNI